MNCVYSKRCGRISLEVTRDGEINPNYYWAGCTLSVHDDASEQPIKLALSLDELHDLRYLIDRALEGRKPSTT